MAGLLDQVGPEDGDFTTLATDTAPVPAGGPAPDAAGPPAGDSAGPPDDRPSLISRIGLGLAGGDPGLYPLTKEQKESAGTRSLLNFGLSLLANSGPTYAPRSAGQIVAAGLESAGTVPAAAERAQAGLAATRADLQMKAGKLALEKSLAGGRLEMWKHMIEKFPLEYRLKLGELGVKEREAAVKEAEAGIKSGQFGLETERFREAMKAGKDGDGLFGQGAGETDPGTPVTAEAAAAIPAIAALPPANRAAAVKAIVGAGMGVNEAGWYASILGPESGGNHVGPDGKVIESPKGARGFGQVMPATFTEMQRKYKIPGTVDDLDANAAASARYFHEGVIDPSRPGRINATIRYNAGPEGLNKFHETGQLPDETKKYLVTTGALKIPRVGTGGSTPTATPPVTPGAAPPRPPVDPNTGARLTSDSAAPPASGTAMPPPDQVSFADLPPDMAQAFRLQLRNAGLAKDGGAAVAKAWEHITKEIREWHATPRHRTLPDAEAASTLGTGYKPGTNYQVDQFGKISPVEQAPAPVPISETPQGMKTRLTMDMSKKTLEQHQTAADAARRTLNSLSAMHSLSDKFGADPIGERYPLINKALMAIPGGGTPEQRQQMTASQAFDGLVSLVSTQLREAGTGRLSNQEMDRFLHALPTIGDTREGRALKIGVLTAISNRVLQENQIAQNHFSRPGGQGDLIGLDDEMAKLGEVIPTPPPLPNRATMTPDQFNAAAAARQEFASRLRPGMLYNSDPDAKGKRHYVVVQ